MKILFVHNQYRHKGGEEQAVENLTRLFQAKGHEVSRFERRSGDWAAHRWWERFHDAARTLYSYKSARELDAQIGHFCPDIVHFHNVFPVISPSAYVVVRKRRLPAVQSVHNYRFLCANGLFLTPEGDICERCKAGSFWNAIRFGCYGNSRIRTVPMAASLALHRAIRTFERSITVFIAPTSFVSLKLREAGFPEQKIVVIPHLSNIPQTQEHRSATPLFLYVGRLSKEKGLWTLLKAFRSEESGRLVVIGDGPLRLELEEFVAQNDLRHISFSGQVQPSEVADWLARAWTLIVPSECYETFGQVILEAWTSGTPVIASQIGALGELVRDEETGWTFEAGNAGQLADRVRYAAHHREAITALSGKCRAAAQKTYNTDDIYHKLITVYEHAISDRTINSGY